MVAPVALDMDAADDAIALQLLERGRHIRAGKAQILDNHVGIDRLVRQIEQGMHLRDRPVDAPVRSHLSPMENEGLGIGMLENAHPLSISVKTEIGDMIACVNGRLSRVDRPWFAWTCGSRKRSGA